MERRYILCDAEKCTGCRICEFACSSGREGSFALELSRIRVVQSSPADTRSMACRFCRNAPCVSVCPRGALSMDEENSIIRLDKGRCAGCGWCIESCPFGAIVLDWGTKTVVMCDLCLGLSQPRCIQFCPKNALSIHGLDGDQAASR